LLPQFGLVRFEPIVLLSQQQVPGLNDLIGTGQFAECPVQNTQRQHAQDAVHGVTEKPAQNQNQRGLD
jgi:hypothetical protein